MPRAVWTGSLAFGLVSIPVALYPATEPKDVRFHLVDPDTGRRVRYRRVVEVPVEDSMPQPEASTADSETDDSTADSEARAMPSVPGPSVREIEVDYDRLARGYEVERDRFAIVDRQEIERVRPTRSSTIDVEHFVPLDDIDPVFFEKSYYLAARGGAERPYLLLHRALEATARVGIGRFVLRTKPHLVAIRPMGGVLGLETLYFADEVREPGAFSPETGDEPPAREVRLAEQLVEILAEDWDPSRYGDEYREELLRLIAEKTPVDREPDHELAPTRPRIEELMAALKRSVEEAKERQAMDPTGKGRKSRRAG
jgi:DNA end-binding protein Ku